MSATKYDISGVGSTTSLIRTLSQVAPTMPPRPSKPQVCDARGPLIPSRGRRHVRH